MTSAQGQLRRLAGGVALVVFAAVLWTAAPPAFAQGEGPDVTIDRLNALIMQQLAGVWSQMVQVVTQDPGFMDTEQWQALMARQQALIGIRYAMAEGMRGPGPGGPEMGPGTGPGGTYQFVSWAEADRTYWVLDTRNGRMLLRETPPPPERDEGQGGE